MKTKKILTCLLAALLLLPTFSSCANEKDSTDPDANPTAGTEEASGESEDSADGIDFTSMSFVERMKYAAAGISDDLPEADYAGSDFIVAFNGDPENMELTGEVVNDATYYQYLNVAERFNVNFKTANLGTSGAFDAYVAAIRAFNQANDHYSDLDRIWNTATSQLVQYGFFADLAQYPCIDITKPWYFGDEMMTYAIKGHMFVATGTMTNDFVGGTNVVFFNKQLQQDYNIEDLYTVVREGRWTMDYVGKLTSDFYYDVNGDGKKDDDDIYGFAYSPRGSMMTLLTTLECPLAFLDADGNCRLSVVDDAVHSEAVHSALQDFIHETPVSRSTGEWNGFHIFTSGHSLLGAYSLGNLSSLREVEWSYGILPAWKFDENQEHYIASYLPYPFAIPSTAPQKDMSAVIMTALSAEGYKQVLPAFYETAIKQKYSSDEESAEMLDLMFSHVAADAMFMYGEGGYIYYMSDFVRSNQGFGSFWKARQKTLNRQIEKSQAAFDELVSMY